LIENEGAEIFASTGAPGGKDAIRAKCFEIQEFAIDW